jgi:2',3'-cyclic-nucleotide 2'-phosphodiesterase (5'-nucleotidase family)
LGNHEFDFGTNVLLERILETKKEIKYMNSNIKHTDSKEILKGTFEKEIIELENDLKVGIFAVTTPSTVDLSKPGKECYFEDVLAVSHKMVKELREKDKVDCVIAMTHLTVAEDRLLAESVPGIDLMLGGHDVSQQSTHHLTSTLLVRFIFLISRHSIPRRMFNP